MKSLIYTALASTILIVGFTAVSLAGHYHHGCKDMKMGNVSEMDTNRDGLVSVDEFTESHLEKYRSWFEMLDTNDDGSLSQEEWDAFLKDHGRRGHSEG